MEPVMAVSIGIVIGVGVLAAYAFRNYRKWSAGVDAEIEELRRQQADRKG